MAKVDPSSEEDYWESIKRNKVQIPVEVNAIGEVNSPPAASHLKVVCISDTHNQLDLVKVSAVDRIALNIFALHFLLPSRTAQQEPSSLHFP
ncbi:unnamed protein product [Heligmosomoides polygyrus]|uniref:PITH domain-containing protein n=1 Tax=Heligmosomoides polygyrus TaxID=6339 RepID=A0A183FXB4_HELPZ|nr:unnamed protein product [Heligmosomoides polygyrus]